MVRCFRRRCRPSTPRSAASAASLDVEQVLQLIVDRVRELVAAQYAALGIVDDDGRITQFITSGITVEERELSASFPAAAASSA